MSEPQPPHGAPPPSGQPYGAPPQPYGPPPSAYGSVPGQSYGTPAAPAYGAVPMQTLGLAPAALTPVPTRRKGVLFTGVAIAAAGIIAAGVLFALSLTMPEKTVEKFARAPSGCTTTLDFSKRATFTLYVETRGTAGISDGDCPANGASYDRADDDLPQVALTMLDSADQEVPMTAVSSPSYDEGAFAGHAVQIVEITEPGSYRLTVASDDTDFAIAVGGDPQADATRLVNTGIGAAVVGVVLGGVLMLLGMRKKPVTPAAAAPGWQPAQPAGPGAAQGWPPQATVPGAVPTYPAQQPAPPTYGQPTYGQPAQPTYPPAPPAPPRGQSGQGWGAPHQ